VSVYPLLFCKTDTPLPDDFNNYHTLSLQGRPLRRLPRRNQIIDLFLHIPYY
jgi:hypothetical protein